MTGIGQGDFSLKLKPNKCIGIGSVIYVPKLSTIYNLLSILQLARSGFITIFETDKAYVIKDSVLFCTATYRNGGFFLDVDDQSAKFIVDKVITNDDQSGSFSYESIAYPGRPVALAMN